MREALERSKKILEKVESKQKRPREQSVAGAPPSKVARKASDETTLRQVGKPQGAVRKTQAKPRSKVLDPHPDVLPKLVQNPRNRRAIATPQQPAQTTMQEGLVRTEFSQQQQAQFRQEAAEQRRIEEEHRRQSWRQSIEYEATQQTHPQYSTQAQSYNYWDEQYRQQ